MNASVVGSGFVGTTLAACLADLGHDVTAVDIDEETVERLNAGETLVHEPGLDALVSAYAGSRLTATTDHADIAETDLTFLAVETPPARTARSTPRRYSPPPKTSARPSPTRTATTSSS